MKKLRLALIATVVALSSLLVPTTATAAGTWQDGTYDSDTIQDCVLNRPNTGVSANVGWWSPTGQVPKVGETFYLRMYAGLVGLPCSGGVEIIPKVVLPPGLEFADGQYKWDVWASGETADIRERAFSYDELGDGVLFGDDTGSSFEVRRGGMFEFQFPVKATREMKGTATRAPECQLRRDGDGPCPVAESGDHFQVGFTVTGHGGDKYYVTPYVPIFVAATAPPEQKPGPNPGTPNPGTPNPGNPNPGNPGPGSNPGTAKAASQTKATYAVRTGKKGKATVTVTSTGAVSGQVVVLDRGKRIAGGVLRGGKASLTLPKLKKGKHVLVAKYVGSAAVAPSAAPARTVKVR